MSQEVEIEKLLKLKRYETPGKAYFNAFLDEFHRYQRSEMLPTRRSFGEKVLAFCQDAAAWSTANVRVAAPVAVAAMVICLSWVAYHPGSTSTGAIQTVETTATPSVVGSSDAFVDGSSVYSERGEKPAELVVAEYSSFERDFSGSQFVTGEAPSSYDSVIAF
jgi:hypothetical protein